MKSKIVTLSIAIVMILALTGQGFATSIPFTDLTNVPEKDQILGLQERGIINGVGNGLFDPDGSITAAQSIQLFVNAFGLNIDNIRFIKEPKATDYFAKANNDGWYANALIIASINVPDLPGDLDPNEKWTREEFTHFLTATIESHYDFPKVKLMPVDIADEDQLTVLYSGSIHRALFYGIAKLDSNNKFNPKEEISRAEAALQVYQALEYIR